MSLMELGVAGVFVILVLKGVVDIIKAAVAVRRGQSVMGNGKPISSNAEINRIHASIQNLSQKMHDLHEWHDKEDSDGSKIWYNKRSAEDRIKDIRELEVQIIKLVEHLIRLVEAQTTPLQKVQELLSDLHANMSAYRSITCPFRDPINDLKNELKKKE